MARNVELYINDIRADFYGDENIDLTESIQNLRDIGKIFTTFSKQFTIPASPKNNAIFKHYYNSDIVNGFDARFLSDAEIKIDGFRFRKGRIKLNGVTMNSGAPKDYRLVFYGELTDVSAILGEDMLEDLPFLYNFDFPYTYANIKSGLESGRSYTINSESFTNVLRIPLLTHTQRLFYDNSGGTPQPNNLGISGANTSGVKHTELKPSIRLWAIIRAIEIKYGFMFSRDFFSTTNLDFYDLYMWLHRASGDVYERVEGYLSANMDTFPVTTTTGIQFTKETFTFTSIREFRGDDTDIWRYIVDFDVQTTGTFTWSVFNGSNELYRSAEITGTGALVNVGEYIAYNNGTYTIRIESKDPITFTSSRISIIRQRYSFAIASDQDFIPTTYSLGADYQFEIGKQIPKIKVMDFLGGLFKMFNLTAYVDNDGVVVVKTLDSFFSGGSEWDLSQKVDITESEILSGNLYEKIEFKYEGLGTLQVEKHNELFKYDWGSDEFIANEQIQGTNYEVKVPFEHMKHERLFDVATGNISNIMWGWSANNLNEDGTASPHLGKPIIHYIPNVSGTTIQIRGEGTNGICYNFNVPSNTRLTTSSNSIHFGSEISEWTLQENSLSLFERFYKNYIEDVFDYQRRLYKYTVYLPINFMLNYTLADTIVIRGKKHKINSIEIDLTTGKAQMELINIV